MECKLALRPGLSRSSSPGPKPAVRDGSGLRRRASRTPGGKTIITSIAPHAGHEACWTVRKTKNGQEINICHSIDGLHTIDVRRNGTGSRMRPLCAEVTTPAEVRVKLRAVFDKLR